MKVFKRMLPARGKQLAKDFPAQWKRFKTIAELYGHTSDREVRVAWEWFMNGATK